MKCWSCGKKYMDIDEDILRKMYQDFINGKEKSLAAAICPECRKEDLKKEIYFYEEPSKEQLKKCLEM